MRGTSFGIAVFVTGSMVAACDNQASQPPGGAADSVEQQEPEVVDEACGYGEARCQCIYHSDEHNRGTFLAQENGKLGAAWDLEFGVPNVVDNNGSHQYFHHKLPVSFKSGFSRSCERLEGLTLHYERGHYGSDPVPVYMWFSRGGNPAPGVCADGDNIDGNNRDCRSYFCNDLGETYHGKDCAFRTEMVLGRNEPNVAMRYRILVLNYGGDSPYVDPDTGIYRRDFVFSSPSGR